MSHILNGPRAVFVDIASVVGLIVLCRYRLHVLWFPKTFAGVWIVAAFGICCMGSFKATGDVLRNAALGLFRQRHRAIAGAALFAPRALAIVFFCLGLEFGMAWVFLLPSRWRRPPYQPDAWIAALVLSALLWVVILGRLWWKEHRGNPMSEA